jgi:tetratricopeptide (TPR) repeat protein
MNRINSPSGFVFGGRSPGSTCKTISTCAVLVALALMIFADATRAQSAAVRSAQPQFDAGDYAAAVNTLRAGIAQDDKDAAAHYWLGRCYYELRKYAQAIQEGELSIKLDPQNSLYHMWLGRSYGEQADRESSFVLARHVKKEFEEAVRLDPNNLQARRDLSEFCVEAPWIVGGSKDSATQQIDAIAAKDPIQGHLARALFYWVQKKKDLAENEYRQVLQAHPTTVGPYFEIADYYERTGDAADMKTVTDAAAKIDPSDKRLGYFRGVAAVLAKSDYAAAERDLKWYLASSADRSDWPAHSAAREWLGRLYEAQGKRAEAAEQYRAALQLDPNRKSATARLKTLESSKP